MTKEQLTEVHATLSALKMCLAINRPNGTTQLVNRINDCHELIETELKQPSTALDLIAQEREKQISKGYTVEHDARVNSDGELTIVARGLLRKDDEAEVISLISNYLPEWDKDYLTLLDGRPYKDRVRIAAAMLVGELERLLFIQNKEA